MIVGCGIDDGSESWREETSLGLGEEEDDASTDRSQFVPVGVWDAGDEALEPETPRS